MRKVHARPQIEKIERRRDYKLDRKHPQPRQLEVRLTAGT